MFDLEPYPNKPKVNTFKGVKFIIIGIYNDSGIWNIRIKLEDGKITARPYSILESFL